MATRHSRHSLAGSRRSSLRPGANGRMRRSSTIYEDDEVDEDGNTGHISTTADIKAGQRAVSGSSYAPSKDKRMETPRSTLVKVYYDVPDEYADLAEIADVYRVNPDENIMFRFNSLEESRSEDQELKRQRETARDSTTPAAEGSPEEEKPKETDGATPPLDNNDDGDQDRDGPRHGANVGGRDGDGDHVGSENKVSKLAAHVYTASYVIFFSLLGTIARVSLAKLATFPGAPVAFTSLWPNFAGCVVMGFLVEDRMLFRHGHGRGSVPPKPASSSSRKAARKADAAMKKTIPMYIGLASGFCGSFTSFSAFVRDVAEATSNDLTYPYTTTIEPRGGGYSVLAVLAVLLVTISLSLGGLFLGAHLAIALEPITPSLPYPYKRRIVDQITVLLAWSCWAATIVLAAWPHVRESQDGDSWLGHTAFALVLAPAGALARFYASLYFNGRIASFPLGTFIVNVGGTALLGMAWDMAHAGQGGVLGCEVLQGFEDGFCGCLTTVSTWVTELTSLRRSHAYVYGGLSVLSAYALMIAIVCVPRWMLWKDGFPPLLCTT